MTEEVTKIGVMLQYSTAIPETLKALKVALKAIINAEDMSNMWEKIKVVDKGWKISKPQLTGDLSSFLKRYFIL
eukprot:15334720-Ditylum_brightwellii.AAC.1